MTEPDNLQPFIDELHTFARNMREQAENTAHPWTKHQLINAAAHCEHAAGSLKVSQSNIPVTEETPLAEKVKDASERRSST